MRNTVHEISRCHTINLRHVALQISFRINCSNNVSSFSPCSPVVERFFRHDILTDDPRATQRSLRQLGCRP